MTAPHLTASSLLLMLRSPCWEDVKYKLASVCLGEIDGILDGSQTEPGLIPLSLLPTANCEKQARGVICQGVCITCFLPVPLRVCSVTSTVDSTVEYVFCILCFNNACDWKELECSLCPPFPTTSALETCLVLVVGMHY